MKKIFSLFLALTLIVTTFAFVVPTAYADDGTDITYTIAHSVKENTTESGEARATIEDHYGKKAVYFKRPQGKNTFFQLDLAAAEADTGDYIVLDVPVMFDAGMYRIKIQAGETGYSGVATINLANTYNSIEAPEASEELINRNNWNNIKIAYKNVVGETAYIYFNGVCVATAELKEKWNTFRFPFDAPSKATSEEVWLAADDISVKKYEVMPALPIYEFDKEKEGNGKNDIVAFVDNEGKQEYVGGVFGREENDKSWYLQRPDGKRARIDGELPVPLKTAIMPGRDVIFEASIYYPAKATRIDIEDSDGQFVRLFAANLEYGKWTKVVVVLNDNDGEKGSATIYLDGKLEAKKDLTKKISSSEANALRIHLGGTPSEGYINYLKVYHVPTGTVTGLEDPALTESTDGYTVDTKEKTITTSNKLDTMTVADLKEALNIAPSAKVRAYSDDEFKNLVTGNLANGYKFVVESEGGILQTFTLKYVAPELLKITEDGVATFTPSENMNGVLIVCAYNDKGVLKKLDVKNVSGADTLASSFSGAYNYKAFVFNSLADTVPLCGSVSVK